MTIDPTLVNVRDLIIRRPHRDGAGGDTDPAEDLVIASRVCAIYEQIHRISRNRRGEELLVEGIYFLDLCDAQGDVLDIRERDYVEHTDLAGRRLQRRAIHHISFWTLEPIDHIELEVARVSAGGL